MGSNNQANNAYATFEALEELNRLVKVKGIELKPTAPKINPVTQTPNNNPNNQAKKAALSKATAPKKAAAPAAKPAPTA
jgi:hypothetical protein